MTNCCHPTVRWVLELGLPPYLFLESCQQISIYHPWSIPFCCGLKVNCFLGRLWNLLVIDPSWGGPGDLGMQLEAYRIALLVPVEIQEVTPQDFIRRDGETSPSCHAFLPWWTVSPGPKRPFLLFALQLLFCPVDEKTNKETFLLSSSYYRALFGIYRWECVVLVFLCLILFG